MSDKQSPAGTSPLEFQVIPTSEYSMFANMVLIKGANDAVLVDTPFARSDAHRVVAEILDSGKNLTTIFITHDHPDHFFGLDVVTDAFPNAKVVAHATVAKDIERSIPIKLARWSPMLGVNAPLRGVVPQPLKTDEIHLEGNVLKVLGPWQGDHARIAAVWHEASGTFIAADLMFNGVYPWLGEHLEAEYDGWLAALDKIEALRPTRIIAGHTKPGLPDDSFSVPWTRSYIIAFRQAAKESKTSAELAAKMHARYPSTVDVANGFLVGVSSQVGVHEIEPWDE